MDNMDKKILDKIKYLEQNYDRIMEHLLEAGSCSTYEKIKKECGIRISMLDKLIELGRQYRAVSGSEGTGSDGKEFIGVEPADARPSDSGGDGGSTGTAGGGPQDRGSLRDRIYSIINRAGDSGKDQLLLTLTALDEKNAPRHMPDLIKMYSSIAEIFGLGKKMISYRYSRKKHVKEVTFELAGRGVKKYIKYEAGIHDFTDKDRAHSSIYVWVMPYTEKSDLELEEKDLRIDVFHSGGHGGQSVNTADSAVRVTHIPTGISAESQEERSQHQNLEKAVDVLRARLMRLEEERVRDEKNIKRSMMLFQYAVDDRIRLYDYNRDLVHDIRLKQDFKDVERIIKGGIRGIIERLLEKEEEEKLDGIFKI